MNGVWLNCAELENNENNVVDTVVVVGVIGTEITICVFALLKYNVNIVMINNSFRIFM